MLRESVHGVLDRGLDFGVDRVDVLAVVDALWVLVEVKWVEQFGADLRGQRKVRWDGLDRHAEGDPERDRQLRPAKLLF